MMDEELRTRSSEETRVSRIKLFSKAASLSRSSLDGFLLLIGKSGLRHKSSRISFCLAIGRTESQYSRASVLVWNVLGFLLISKRPCSSALNNTFHPLLLSNE